MDVEAILAVAALLKNCQHSVQVVHCPLHCRSAVHVHYGWPRIVDGEHLSEVVVVNLARLQCLHLQEREGQPLQIDY